LEVKQLSHVKSRTAWGFEEGTRCDQQTLCLEDSQPCPLSHEHLDICSSSTETIGNLHFWWISYVIFADFPVTFPERIIFCRNIPAMWQEFVAKLLWYSWDAGTRSAFAQPGGVGLKVLQAGGLFFFPIFVYI
jgi:hypothetical protein